MLFNDVVVFDVTYKTNSFSLPFAPFTGVNHHWQSTLFGMKTSQRSESINTFFDGFVHRSTPLSEFVYQYDNAITDNRDKEEDQDFICITTKSDLTKVTLIESHAKKVHTKNVFNKFKEEFDYIFLCRNKKIKKDEDISSYQVTCKYDDKSVSHIVNVIKEAAFECSCAKFETAGLLCKHILYSMKQKFDFTSIPDKYILQRWKINERYTTSGKVDQVPEESQNLSSHEVTALEAWNFRTYMDKLFDRAVHHREFFVAAFNCLGSLSEQLDIIKK
ncbi:protein FAR-RED IMPAIRED RESPONSE 1-like [Apium graveolens]|uniref:protein FAR-RED IMPAIRED RESPONSE 1-like n=1 Tax=Apium graveolens TaxID=4045 RepID=UPI003D7AA578